MSAISPAVDLVEGRPVVSSLQVAEHFGKFHKNVVRKIESLDLPDDFRRLNFEPTSRSVPGPNGTSRKEVMYNLTRDGFTILAMGFTGKKAMQWKIRFIEAFNAMEQALAESGHGQKALPVAADPFTPTIFEACLLRLIIDWLALFNDNMEHFAGKRYLSPKHKLELSEMLKGRRQFTLANFAALADLVGMETDTVIKQAIKEAHVLSIMEPNVDVHAMLADAWSQFNQRTKRPRLSGGH
jgi:Rha family phage regulatory protein